MKFDGAPEQLGWSRAQGCADRHGQLLDVLMGKGGGRPNRGGPAVTGDPHQLRRDDRPLGVTVSAM